MNKNVWAKLVNKQKTYNVQLDLQVGELRGTGPLPDDYVVEHVALDSTCQRVVEDGDYNLEYSFNGRQERSAVRVAGGMLLSRT